MAGKTCLYLVTATLRPLRFSIAVPGAVLASVQGTFYVTMASQCEPENEPFRQESGSALLFISVLLNPGVNAFP